jgi:hypothetical protein
MEKINPYIDWLFLSVPWKVYIERFHCTSFRKKLKNWILFFWQTIYILEILLTDLAHSKDFISFKIDRLIYFHYYSQHCFKFNFSNLFVISKKIFNGQLCFPHFNGQPYVINSKIVRQSEALSKIIQTLINL